MPIMFLRKWQFIKDVFNFSRFLTPPIPPSPCHQTYTFDNPSFKMMYTFGIPVPPPNLIFKLYFLLNFVHSLNIVVTFGENGKFARNHAQIVRDLGKRLMVLF